MFDTHVHLNDQYEAVLQRAFDKGVHTLVNIALTLEDLDRGLEICRRYPTVHLAAAIHPCYVQKDPEVYFRRIKELAFEKKLIAIGETGLDLYHNKEDLPLQKSWFIRHITLANELHLPLIVHCRNAYTELFILLEEHPIERGVLHCFSGTLEEGQKAIDQGLYLSISGVVTFKNALEVQKIVQSLPMEHLLIETDAPYLAPVPFRGKENEPSYIEHTLKKCADLCNLSFKEMEKILDENAARFFQLSSVR